VSRQVELGTSGASLRELMDRMGHSSSRAALIYQHSTDERQRTLAEAVARQVEAALDAGVRGTYGARPARPLERDRVRAGGRPVDLGI
jgi:hypothetical protein